MSSAVVTMRRPGMVVRRPWRRRWRRCRRGGRSRNWRRARLGRCRRGPKQRGNPRPDGRAHTGAWVWSSRGIVSAIAA